ncbi:MAG: DNA replication/repair protein RecF [Alphaproteobacteria bacterium CG11_big_fil_rev_8_21_14_0_20_44_7]|nr:MAG: DNA replication/repair protein RecF [Alphaproteobacteria bacterium CG11_big_fil_rev_8_21_14_0_20_44_7]
MLTKITLTNFRNYGSSRLEFGNLFTIITGHNGAGKTNLLEAISLLSPGRGLRSANLADIKKHGQNEWSVVGEVGGYKIATGLEIGRERRTVKIDSEKQSGANMLAEYVSCIWLTPQMDNIFLESNSERRRFFDRIIYNFDPEHASRVAVYENTMRERLKLLKDGINDRRWLAALEQRMAEYGIAIAAARNEVIAYLQNSLDKAKTSFPRPQITMMGVYENMLHESSALSCEESFVEKLKNSRDEDARNGRTNHGVHKTDFAVTHTEKNMPANLCSTGEQKALLLSITLGLARLLRERKNRTPILLLDEVVAHLDENRRKELFDELENLKTQSFLTGTENALFTGLLGNSEYVKLENSNVI